jgi:hypothetical protein
MNNNTKFPALPNPLFPSYTKHGIVHPPLTIINGNNKTHSAIVKQAQQSDSTTEIHEHYNDTTSESIVYEERPTITNVPIVQQTIDNVFDLSKYLKK